jgi:uncharacterized protein (DUF1778 family)
MNREAKEPISLRVSPETKYALEERSIELGFRSLSEFLLCALENELKDSRIKDEKLEELIDLSYAKLVQKASSPTLNTYSTVNLTRKDIKDALFEDLEKRINNEKLGLTWAIRRRLKRK